MKNNISAKVSVITMILVVILLLGASVALHSFTLVEWWQPVVVCAFIAVLLTLLFAKIIKPTVKLTSDYWKYVSCFVLSFSTLLSAFYFINYQFADSSTISEYSAPVVGKYSKERTRNKGMGRRGRGVEKYNVHFIEIELSDGSIKNLEKPLSEYLKIKVGDKIKVEEEKGFFGINVIKLNHNQSNSNNQTE